MSRRSACLAKLCWLCQAAWRAVVHGLRKLAEAMQVGGDDYHH